MIHQDSIHDATLKRAETEEANGTKWLRLVFFNRSGHEAGAVTIFSRTPEERADHERVAKAINDALGGKTGDDQ